MQCAFSQQFYMPLVLQGPRSSQQAILCVEFQRCINKRERADDLLVPYILQRIKIHHHELQAFPLCKNINKENCKQIKREDGFMNTFNHKCRGSQASKFEQAALKKSGFSLNPLSGLYLSQDYATRGYSLQTAHRVRRVSKTAQLYSQRKRYQRRSLKTVER